MEHECIKFVKRINNIYNNWLNKKIPEFTCKDCLMFALKSKSILDQTKSYNTSIKPSSQTKVQALLVQELDPVMTCIQDLSSASNFQTKSQPANLSSQNGKQKNKTLEIPGMLKEQMKTLLDNRIECAIFQG